MDHVYQSVMMMLQLCQRKCPPAVDVMLPDGDETVRRELMHSLSKGHDTSKREWVTKHAQLYALLGVRRVSSSPIPGTETSPWFQSLTLFQRSVLLYSQHKRVCSTPKASAADVASGQKSAFMTDVYPNILRERVSVHYEGVGEISPCVVPRQIMWLNFQDREPRLMVGKEAMLLQGWPIDSVDLPDWAGNKLLQDLAGNGVALPVMLALVMSTLSALTFTKENCLADSDSAEDPNVQEALKLLASMTHNAADLVSVNVLPTAATASGTTSKAEAAPDEDITDTPAVEGEKRRRLSGRNRVQRLPIAMEKPQKSTRGNDRA